MPFRPLFGGFEPLIKARFSAAKQDAGKPVSDVTFEIHEEPDDSRSLRAEFLSFGKSRKVRITWNGVASLWACAQGAARVCRVMYDGKRAGATGLNVEEQTDLEQGMACIVLVKRLFNGDVPIEFASSKHWPAWAPSIDPSASPDTDIGQGNAFFLGALGWILRHELAHIARNHDMREKTEGLHERDAEKEADKFATLWLRGDRKADPDRMLGSPAAEQERNLDFRAISLGIGLLWVAMFEAHASWRPDSHPRVAERLDACLGSLELRDDSPGFEILADFIQAWIRPEYAAPVPIRVARDAMDLMLRELYLLERSGRNPWPEQVK